MLTSIKNQKHTQNDLWLWPPTFFAFGAAFYISFVDGFLVNITKLALLFLLSVLLSFLNRKSLRCFIFLSCAVFLLGSFYGFFYEKLFVNYTKITGKVYVDVVGKVEVLKPFANPMNGSVGVNLVISQPKMFQAEFKQVKKVKKPKKKKAKKKKDKKKSAKKKPKKAKKEKLKKEEQKDKKKPKKKPKKKVKKKRKISPKTIEKNYLNVAGYQEIDRQFLDLTNNYQAVKWLKIKGKNQFPNASPKISLNLVKNFSAIAINDLIAVRVFLQPREDKEFFDDFDFEREAKFKKIGAYGFAIGEARILRKGEIDGLKAWFLALRSKIDFKISNHLKGDEAAIAKAFLIGDQNGISPDLISKIRISGLAHLLSISGFHLSLAASLFFVLTRYLLSRSEFLALNFDLKKFAAIAAILASYFYLEIAAAPIPAQRAFLAVLFVATAIYANQKINPKRAVIFAALFLILLNPYAVFNLSFQLSFVAIMVLCCLASHFVVDKRQNYLRRIISYFWQIIVVSLTVQIATAPFLISSFHSFSTYGFLANIIAVPITTFWIMPCGFLALFLMIISAEKYALLLMGKGILLIEKIAVFSSSFDYTSFANLSFPNLYFLLSIVALLLICLAHNMVKNIGFVLFIFSFIGIFLVHKPQIAFAKRQDFFVIYNEKRGLVFSKELRDSKRRQSWMNWFSDSEFKSLQKFRDPDILCDEKKCIIDKKRKILVLLKRNKISEICKNDYDVIVNLTSKYALPNCIFDNKTKIDNFDFYQKGGQFFYENKGSYLVRSSKM